MNNIDYVKRIAELTREFIIFKFKESECKCAVSSTLISLVLKNKQIKSEIHQNEFHAFVFCEDHIIDVTADQFGKEYDEVCVIHFDKIKNSKLNYIWDTVDKFDCPGKFLTYQHKIESGWPEDQILTHYKELDIEYLDFLRLNEAI